MHTPLPGSNPGIPGSYRTCTVLAGLCQRRASLAGAAAAFRAESRYDSILDSPSDRDAWVTFSMEYLTTGISPLTRSLARSLTGRCTCPSEMICRTRPSAKKRKVLHRSGTAQAEVIKSRGRGRSTGPTLPSCAVASSLVASSARRGYASNTACATWGR
jgi:hypothetical protein